MLREIDLYEPADFEMFIAVLKQLRERGFKYIARDSRMYSVTCYAAKPKKYYLETGDFYWGYREEDLGKVEPAHPIFYHAPGINSNAKSAMLIDDWLKVNEVE